MPCRQLQLSARWSILLQLPLIRAHTSVLSCSGTMCLDCMVCQGTLSQIRMQGGRASFGLSYASFVTYRQSTPYHPQTDGQTEHANKTLEEMLRHFVNPTRNDWDGHLDAAEFACNKVWHESIRTRHLYLLNSGRHPYTPISMGLDSDVPLAKSFMQDMQAAVRSAKHYMEMVQQRQKAYFDKNKREETFKEGQLQGGSANSAQYKEYLLAWPRYP